MEPKQASSKLWTVLAVPLMVLSSVRPEGGVETGSMSRTFPSPAALLITLELVSRESQAIQ